MKKTYSEKLKDPRWQKKRLEKLQEQDFACQNCLEKERELHVHHFRYVSGRDPWDYDAYELFVLCSRCHEAWHHVKDALDHWLCLLCATPDPAGRRPLALLVEISEFARFQAERAGARP